MHIPLYDHAANMTCLVAISDSRRESLRILGNMTLCCYAYHSCLVCKHLINTELLDTIFPHVRQDDRILFKQNKMYYQTINLSLAEIAH